MAEAAEERSRGVGVGGNGPDAPPEARRGSRPREMDEGRVRRRWYQRPLLLVVLGVVLVALIVVVVIWWLHSRQWESTDDAYISAHVAPVTPRLSGVALRVHVSDNQDVAAGAVVGGNHPRHNPAPHDQARGGVSGW